MKKNSSNCLEPEVDDLCDLVARVIVHSEKGGDDGHPIKPRSQPESGDAAVSTVPTPPNN